MKSHSGFFSQRGSMLLEAFIAILLFSTGILGLMGLQAVSLKNTADAKYRAEASYLANQIIGQMWADSPGTLGSYAHNPGTTPNTTCTFTGAGSANANVLAWLGNASTPGTVAGNLPGATAARQQIFIGANNLVTVTICWQTPSESVPRNFVGFAQINGS